MFDQLKPAKKKTDLDEAIEEAVRELKGHEAHTEAYANIVKQITKLKKIQDTKKDRLSKDTLALVLGNLAGIFVIVGHEHVNVITSKAFSMVGKTRLT